MEKDEGGKRKRGSIREQEIEKRRGSGGKGMKRESQEKKREKNKVRGCRGKVNEK